MAIMVSSKGDNNIEPAPEGNHFAVCDMVVDLGKQLTEYKGEKKEKHQVYIRWQIPSERKEWEYEGEKHEGPVQIGKTYTASLNEKSNLRKDLKSWRTRDFTAEELDAFDVSKLLGVSAMVTITHTDKDDKTYANVSAVGGLPKGMPKVEPEGSLVLYDDENLGSYENLPKWLRDKVDAAINGNSSNGDNSSNGTDPNDPDAWRGQDLGDTSDEPF